MTYDQWIKTGIDNGWCGPPLCYTHDGLPTSPLEDLEIDQGHDPCIGILRLYDDPTHRQGIELNHSPSQWRNHWNKENTRD